MRASHRTQRSACVVGLLVALVAGFARTLACAGATGTAGPLPPAAAARTFHLDPGLRVDLVAAEPLVRSPAALAWDEQGQLFVAENPGYPTGPGPGQPPVGAIIELVDTDADGRADRRVAFAEGLGFPNGLMPWNHGWLVTDAPDLLWLADTNHDGRADTREIWFTGFATNQTTQLRACYPVLGPDGWIYVARGWSGGVVTSPRWPYLPAVDLKDGDFRFRPDGSAAEAIGGNAQFGQVLDDVGRRFLVSNRNPLMQAVVLPRWWRRHPALPFTDLVQDVSPNGYGAKVFPHAPDTTTSGFMPEFLAAPHAGTFTSACGIHQFTADGLGPGYQGHWFICEPAQSLVQRQIATTAGPTFTSRPATEGRDFLASSDGWCHPVYAATGPDGALYVADLYRGIIDHPDYLPEDARAKLDFAAGKELGRLWRVCRQDFTPQPRSLATAALPALLDALGATNGWVRETAHRLLLDRRDTNTLAALVGMLAEALPRLDHNGSWTNLVRLEADPPVGPHLGTVRRLWLLQGFLEASRPGRHGSTELLNRANQLILFATFDPSPAVRETAWRIVHEFPPDPKHALPDVPYELVYWWADDPNPAVRFHFALQCGDQDDWSPVVPALVRVARRDASDRWTRAAVLSGLKGREAAFLQELFRPEPVDGPGFASLLDDLGRLLGVAPKDGAAALLDQALEPRADGTEWQVAALRGLSEGLRQGGHGPLTRFLRDHAPSKHTTSAWLARFEAVGTRVAASARVPVTPLPLRVAATRFLAELEYRQARDPLVDLLDGAHPADLRLAAARALGRFDEPEVGRLLLERNRWNTYSAAIRESALAAVASRTTLLPGLFDALERGDLAVWAVDPQRRKQLQQHADPALRARARTLFATAGGSDRRQVFEELKPLLSEPASGARGRAVFLRTCAQCHVLGGEGVKVGPDLTGVRNQPPEALLLHILVPDAEIYPGYQACEVETRDGRSLTGLLVVETAETVVLRRAGGEQESLARAQIASFTLGRVSLMPQELEKTMTRQELADLLALLRGQP